MNSINSINFHKLHKPNKLKGGFAPLEKSTLQNKSNIHNFRERSRYSLTGFTLVEVIFVVFFGTIILGLVWSILSAGEDAWYTADTKIEIQDNLRIGIDRMVKELQGVNSIDGTIFDANNISDNFLRFFRGANTIEYSIANNQLRRTEGGNVSVLANNINSVRFTVLGGDMLEIDLSGRKSSLLQRELNSNLTSRVVLRN